jgi:hypothetical protein
MDADPAVHAAIRSIFPTTYLMHCTFYISQNLILNQNGES